jgi:wyosine [tRNA(Phe)-imidazoG37] synthetase (radical SAM superfamily)
MAGLRYVFGPVPSRRLGSSLGIDPIPLKTCNWNCVYCQIGRSRPLTNERKEYEPCDEILTEVRQTLDLDRDVQIDWITFVGSGEPTLHSGLGKMIRQVKTMTSLPIAVITNGALLYLPEVRDELTAADAVLPSLDAGNPTLYRKINRPWPKLTFVRQIEGLIAFRKEYSGKLWVEVMLIQGMNDSEEALREIAIILERVQPDQVHLNVPNRPPVETWVQLPEEKSIQRAKKILGEQAQIVSPPLLDVQVTYSGNLTETIMSVITRHPMKEQELYDLLEQSSPSEVHAALEDMEALGQAQAVERYGVRFWCPASAYFPDEGSPGEFHHRH